MRTVDLKSLQAWFSAEMMGETISDLNLRHLIRSSEAFPTARRLRVYSYARGARFKEALRMDYPFVTEILKENFDRIAEGYIKSFPSFSYTLDKFGHGFSKYLSAHEILATYPYLSDLAALEWSMAETYFVDGVATHRLSPETLKEVSMETATFLINPSLRFFRSRFDLYNAVEDSTGSHSPSEIEYLYLVYNNGEDSFFEPASPCEVALWTTLREGKTLQQACDQLAQIYPEEIAPTITDSLSRGVQNYLIQGITVGH